MAADDRATINYACRRRQNTEKNDRPHKRHDVFALKFPQQNSAQIPSPSSRQYLHRKPTKAESCWGFPIFNRPNAHQPTVA